MNYKSIFLYNNLFIVLLLFITSRGSAQTEADSTSAKFHVYLCDSWAYDFVSAITDSCIVDTTIVDTTFVFSAGDVNVEYSIYINQVRRSCYKYSFGLIELGNNIEYYYSQSEVLSTELLVNEFQGFLNGVALNTDTLALLIEQSNLIASDFLVGSKTTLFADCEGYMKFLCFSDTICTEILSNVNLLDTTYVGELEIAEENFTPNADWEYLELWNFDDKNHENCRKGPDPEACDNEAVKLVESMLEVGTNYFRADFHVYQVDTVESIICNSYNYNGSYDCSLIGVWNFLKSNNIYQAPIYSDFPTSINVSWSSSPVASSAFGIIHNAFQTQSAGPYNEPIENCDLINIAPSPLRQSSGYLFNLSGWLSSSCLSQINPDVDPVLIVVDEERLCITNYTLPGHILYPGKVQRCVTSDDCGENIRIHTLGIGFHNCGNNVLGRFFAVSNFFVGKSTFTNLTRRVNKAFND
jgi:hypothetical protein